MTLHPVRGRLLLVGPIRLVLGVGWYAGARLAGAGATGAAFAFATAAVAIVFLAFNDPRAAFRRVGTEPLPAPDDARVAGRARQALRALLPSTVGVSVLAAIAIVPQPVLAAFLGGVSAGLGLAGLLAAPRIDASLLVDPGTGVVYRR